MLIALIGSHGTGKTTVFDAIKKIRPQWQYFSEGVRHQVPAFGFTDPHQIVGEIGIGAFELMNINSWSIIDPQVNSLFNRKIPTFMDRSPIDNYAYYLTLKGENDVKFEKLVRGMAKHYAGIIDLFVYFPIGIFPLKGDDMRPDDKEYQKRLDQNFREALKELGIPESKIYALKAITVKGRVEEILALTKKG